MAVSAKAFGQALLKALNKEVDYDSDTIKVMLCTSGYTPNQDTHVYKSSVTNEVASGGGYTTGGATLGSKTITYDGPTNTITLDAADVVWATATFTARIAVVYVSTGSDATSVLLGYVDFGADQVGGGGDFKITWDAAGMMTFIAS